MRFAGGIEPAQFDVASLDPFRRKGWAKCGRQKAGVLARTIEPTGSQAGFAIPAAGSLNRARVEAFGRAERHSRRVRRLKVVLPLSAIAMIAAFVGYTYLTKPAQVSVDAAVGSSISDGKLVMSNPKLEGFTKDGKPYSMTARRAVQSFEQQGVIDLEGIDGTMTVEDGNAARVVAETGVYDRGKNTLDLKTEITVTTTSGIVATLQSAFLDIDKGTLLTTDPVEITSNGSMIVADSMSLLDNGKLIVFEKRVRMTIDQSKAGAAQKGGGETNASN